MDTKIFKNGIKFQCQGSANCCVSRGSYGYVYLSKKDINTLSNYFNISPDKFKKKYCQLTNGYLHLKEYKKKNNCIFLKDKKCNVYKARPIQCRTWPFWPENMNYKKWNKEIINFCPGIGKGRKWNKKDIEKKLKIEKENEEKINALSS